MQKIWHGNWEGRESTRWTGVIDELRQLIPTFAIWNFNIGEGVNKYLDLIVRKPLGETGLGDEVNPMKSVYIPIAAVSNDYQRNLYRGRRQGYKLVQHHEMLDSILKTLKVFSKQDNSFENSRFRVLPVTNPESLEATLKISEYGARMQIGFLAPNYEFYPDDGEPYVLKIICLNSVDRKFALRIGLSLYRDEFSDEIFIAGFHRTHTQELEDGAIEAFLNREFDQFANGSWISRTVPETTIDALIITYFKNVDFREVKRLYAKLLEALGGVESHVRKEAGEMNYFLFCQVISTLVHEQETLRLQEQKMAQLLDMLEKISEEDR